MTSESSLSRVETPRGILAEGIVWDGASDRLSWVDIELGLLHVATVEGDAPRPILVHELGDQLGCAIPAIGGGWVCGLGRSLAVVRDDGVVVETTPTLLHDSERFNDGHADPQGRLVIGTLNSDGPDGRQILTRLERDGELAVIQHGIGISNGIAWSPDGEWMYHVDTAARAVSRRAYGDDIGEPELFAEINGMPDGIAVDTDGRVWVTVFDQGRVECYDAAGDRVPDLSITVPDAHVTSVGFGGADLDVLFVATGMPIMRRWLQRRRPQDGLLFRRPSPVRGLPTHRWTKTSLPDRIMR